MRNDGKEPLQHNDGLQPTKVKVKCMSSMYLLSCNKIIKIIIICNAEQIYFMQTNPFYKLD